MGSKRAWMFLVLMLISLEGWLSEGMGCWEEERIALLQLKPFLNSTYYLQDWVDGDENSNCCQWKRVECNSTTGRVIKLYLSYVRKVELGDQWYLNTSLFSPFQELQWLDLSWNGIVGLVQSKGLQKLPRLEVLDLGGNFLNNSIFSSLSGLTSLKALHLNQNRLNGTLIVQGVESLRNLGELDLSGNQIAKFVFPKDFKGLRKLYTLYLENLENIDGSTLLQSLGPFSSLKKLDLSYSHFRRGTITTQELKNLTNVEDLILDYSSLHTSILQIVGAFTSLKRLSMKNCKLSGILDNQGVPNFKNLKSLFMDGTALNISFFQIIKPMASLEILSLSTCGLTGTLPNQGLCKLKQLQELYMNRNNLRGTLPWCLANLTSLRLLDISSNQINESISSSTLKNLISIQYLRLSNNHFKIPISLEPFFNHSKLKKFYGENNQIYKEIESHSLAPRFQLNSVVLGGYGDGGTFPKFLYHQYDLDEVDLSHINLKGEFPNWLLENNTKLETLLLVNNSLSGPFQLPIHPHLHLTSLDLSVNNFYGHIPIEIGTYLSKLLSLNISKNAFNGSIPSSIGDMNSLESLDFSNNNFYGEIPEHLAKGSFSLQLLVLSNNNLEGHLFSKNFNLTNLKRLQLDNNNLIGNIPESLSNCSLEGLYLGDNHFSGKIPGWLGNMSELVDFIMPSNHLEGPIPMEFCRLNFLEILDLSKNNISGYLPFCLQPCKIKQVHLSRNKLQGQLNDTFYYSLSLETLDLSYNFFTGNLPNWIGRLSLLRHLILGKNNLEGELPLQLCELDQLRIMDLSHNNFTGFILPCLNMSERYNKGYDAATLTSGFLDQVPAYTPLPAFAYSQIGPPSIKEETIDFTTKNITYTYGGRILMYMSGLDLSGNKLIGEIPRQIGNLTMLHTLNFSHNNLTGPIPSEFSNLKQIESLDLSYNNLNGKIPPKLVKLDYLAVFSVAHNNLSGKTPEYKGQFATFEDSSYEGNPLLCGLPVSKICKEIESSPTSVVNEHEDNHEDSNFIDWGMFYISFTVSYTIMLLGFFVVLYVNPHWRQVWFYLAEKWITFSYYFIVDYFL